MRREASALILIICGWCVAATLACAWVYERCSTPTHVEIERVTIVGAAPCEAGKP